MGIALALLVFLYPLGLPLVTLAAFIMLAILTRARASSMLALGVPLVLVLVAILGPIIVRTGSGSFALPWWAQAAGVEYYVWQYALVCLGLLGIFTIGASIYRLFVPVQAPSAKPPAPARSNLNTEAISVALREFRAGQPITQVCAVCGSPILIESNTKQAAESRTAIITCSCTQCNGTFAL